MEFEQHKGSMVNSTRKHFEKLLPPSPRYSFVGGLWYDTTPGPNTNYLYSAKPYSGENYAYFRIYKSIIGDRAYLSTIYVNLPMAVFQYEKEAIGLIFQPLSRGGKPLSLAVYSGDEGVIFEYRNGITHLFRQKSSKHLGDWESEREYVCDEPIGEVLEVSAHTWMELVRRYIESKLQGVVAHVHVGDVVRLAVGFHDRTFDSEHNIHVDTVLPFAPRAYPDRIYSYPSFEGCRLASLARVPWSDADRLARIAERLLSDNASVEMRELGDVRVWHNALVPCGSFRKLEYTTSYGTGYSGWPGGMAWTLRGLTEYCLLEGKNDAHTRDRIRSGMNWFLAIQLPDGGFPFNTPTFEDLAGANGRCMTGPRSYAVGGAAEAVRTLCAGYKLLGDERLLSAARKAADAINPHPPHYAFRGYGDLRDAGDYESDSTSGCSLANANLDLFELTGDPRYLEVAIALGYYTLTWHFWWTPGPDEILGVIDPVAESFSPHASPWNTALATEMYCRLYQHTKDEFWRRVAHCVFSQCAKFQNQATGGISEAYPIRLDGSYTDQGGESAMVSWALILGGIALCRAFGVSIDATAQQASGGYDASVALTAKIAVRNLRRPIAWIVKGVAKSTAKALIRKTWKYCPTWLSARLTKYTKNPSKFGVCSKALGRPRTIHLEMGEICDGFACKGKVSSEAAYLSLRSSNYDTHVDQVLMPVVTFPSPVQDFEVIEKLGEIIVAVLVTTETKECYEIRFLEGTSGIGPTSAFIQNGQLVFDVTLKALWEHAGLCSQRISVRRCGTNSL